MVSSSASTTSPVGERKIVTVLFADIVGSTSYAERMDPEDWRDALVEVHRRGDEAVARHGGTVAQHLGDGLLAFFGAPVTHEDDPLRAVRAALEMQHEVAAIPSLGGLGTRLQMRVGMDTGVIVVGPLNHDGKPEYTGTGDTMNRAARLQGAADPGGVLVSEATFVAVQHAARAEDRGFLEIRGSRLPARAWAVTGVDEAAVARRVSEPAAPPFIGREDQMRALDAAAEAVRRGAGRTSIVVGEPGVGKSRLVDEWRRSADLPGGWVEAGSGADDQQAPYRLVISLVRALAGIEPTATDERARSTLSELARQRPALANEDARAVLARLLSITPTDAERRTIEGLGPRGFQTWASAVARELLVARAAGGPYGIVCEDVHWADPASASLLVRLLPVVAETPVLLCLVTRREPDSAGWALVEAACRSPESLEVEVGPLPDEASRRLAEATLGASLPRPLLDTIIERADGNPLFVQEVIRGLLQREVLRRDASGAFEIAGDEAEAGIPDSLGRLLQSRVDRLDLRPKRTLRIASVIGRDFDVDVLATVMGSAGIGGDRGAILADLGTLESAGLVAARSASAQPGYAFRHALLREAAYASVLRADRRPLHIAVGEALERADPERVGELSPTLAFHFERGGDPVRSAHYFVLAADRARERYANIEAIALYRAALTHLDALAAAAPATARQTACGTDADEAAAVMLANPPVAIRLTLGELLTMAGRRDEAVATLQAAAERLATAPDLARARVHRGLGDAWMEARGLDDAEVEFDHADRLLAETAAHHGSGWCTERLALDMSRIQARYWVDDVGGMEALVPGIEQLLTEVGTDVQRSRFHSLLALYGLIRSRFAPDQSTATRAELALAAARESGSLEELAFSGFVVGFVHLGLGELDAAEMELRATIETCRRIGDRVREAPTWAYLADIARRRGDVEAVRQLLPAAIEAADAAGFVVYRGAAEAHRAWILLAEEGPTGDAGIRVAAAARTAIEEMRTDRDHPFTCWAHWPGMAVALAANDVDDALERARAILGPHQVRQPAAIEAALSVAVALASAGEPRAAVAASLERALALAREDGLD